uniref:Uncharacterized protein n=1 Tax=Kryptolebias marmoratus TaxID=37003 RepID=A0A3Q3AAG2_KRYMA
PPPVIAPLTRLCLDSVAASMQNGLWQFLSHQHLRRTCRSFQRELWGCICGSTSRSDHCGCKSVQVHEK